MEKATDSKSVYQLLAVPTFASIFMSQWPSGEGARLQISLSPWVRIPPATYQSASGRMAMKVFAEPAWRISDFGAVAQLVSALACHARG